MRRSNIFLILLINVKKWDIFFYFSWPSQNNWILWHWSEFLGDFEVCKWHQKIYKHGFMYFKQTVESTCCKVLFFHIFQMIRHGSLRPAYGVINKYTLSNLNPFLVALSITAGSRAIVHSNLISKLILLLIFEALPTIIPVQMKLTL